MPQQCRAAAWGQAAKPHLAQRCRLLGARLARRRQLRVQRQRLCLAGRQLALDLCCLLLLALRRLACRLHCGCRGGALGLKVLFQPLFPLQLSLHLRLPRFHRLRRARCVQQPLLRLCGSRRMRLERGVSVRQLRAQGVGLGSSSPGSLQLLLLQAGGW